MDFAVSKSPFWIESMRACTVSLLFKMFSFTTNKAVLSKWAWELMMLPMKHPPPPPVDKRIVYDMPLSV
jgi:hypothetical protein